MNADETLELRDMETFPDASVLQTVLGPAFPSFEKLIALFESSNMTHEWRYYNDGKAWLCKVQHGKRTIIWMSAWRGFMKTTVYFPLSKLNLVMDLDISESTKTAIRETGNVGKSKPCIIKIGNDESLPDLKMLMELKIKTK